MSQVLHIFRKDTRQHWIEILLSVVVTAGFFLKFPSMWRAFEEGRRFPNSMVGILAALTVVCWWVLIARVIFEEAQVGDRRWWLSRPYVWWKLLAAKGLFIVVWIVLPFFLGQLLLLAEAEFHPAAFVGSAIGALLFASVCFLLPVFAVASVTANFARLTLSVVIGFCAILGYVNWFNFWQSGYVAYVPHSHPFLLPIVSAGCAAVILTMYALRRPWLSRGLVVLAIPAVLIPLNFLYGSRFMVERAYPAGAAGSASPLTVMHGVVGQPLPYLSSALALPNEARLYQGKEYVGVSVVYSGVPSGYTVFVDNFRFTLTNADGASWTSPWQMLLSPTMPVNPGDRVLTPGDRLSLMLTPAQYDRFRSAPVTLHLEFALSLYKSASAATLSYPAGDIAVPGIGFCAAGRGGYQNALQCRFAEPAQLTYVMTSFRSLPCSRPWQRGDEAPAYGWISRESSDFSITSVRDSVVFFHGSPNWRVCPGTPITFTQYQLVDRTRTSLTIPNFQIPENNPNAD